MEPISSVAGTLSVKFLEEGIKFLWNQAGEIIKRYYEKKKDKNEEKKEEDNQLEKIESEVPQIIQLSPIRKINFQTVERNFDTLKELRKKLFPYAFGDEELSIDDATMLQYADQLHTLLIQIFDEEIDFSSVKIEQAIKSIDHEGKVTGMKSEELKSGQITIKQVVEEHKGEIIGIDTKKIGK